MKRISPWYSLVFAISVIDTVRKYYVCNILLEPFLINRPLSFYQNREDLAHTPSIGGKDLSQKEEEEFDGQNTFLKLVKDITSKGFVRSNYKKNLVDLSDIKINLKGKK